MHDAVLNEEGPKRPISSNAYWLNGIISDDTEWYTVDTVSESFIGRPGIYLSTPLTYSIDNVWIPSLLLSNPKQAKSAYISFLEFKYVSTVRLIQPLLLDDFKIDGKMNSGKLRIAIHIYYMCLTFCAILFGRIFIDLKLSFNWFDVLIGNFFHIYGSFEIFDFINRYILSNGWITIIGNKTSIGKIYRDCIIPYYVIIIALALINIETADSSIISIIICIMIYQFRFRLIYFCKGDFFGSLIKIS